ncbi:hypothetical protein JAAARDRAFT_630242 [Jaapia argillacea MUCL 33604]|uniref:Uncharacterized protein n=1 Tax=Jaapia argillacea MUCL 33604 TaxID=933084 RepID=A0A067Q895_9AGAM|nr:hypothetical protein JAAARDRAFT_630242 [Jaapia argillacea MUCL 33604]
MASEPHQANSPSIPVETFILIFEFIPLPEHLSNLCLVSRLFYQEASRILYRSIQLLPRNSDEIHPLIPFHDTLITSPNLGTLVQSFMINVNPVPRYDLLSSVLRSLPNLRQLRIHGSHDNGKLPSDMFDGCTFHLDLFHSTHIRFREINQLLSMQPDISDWSHWLHNYDIDPIPDHILPNLHTMNIPALLLPAFVNPRPIRRLKLLFIYTTGRQELTICQTLASFNNALTSLSVYRPDSFATLRRLNMAHLIQSIAEALPDLQHLDFVDMDDCGLEKDGVRNLALISGALAGFKSLRTLLIDPKVLLLGRTQLFQKTLPHLADTIMSTCPSLEVIAFPVVHKIKEIISYSKTSQGAARDYRPPPFLHSESWRNF